MNMRYLTLLTTLTLLGFSISAFAAKPDCPDPDDHRCNADPVVLYTVTSAGISLVSGTDWRETNKGQIDSKDGTSVLDLSYFRDQFGPSGDACFPTSITLFEGGFKKKGKSALGAFWFLGRTKDSEQVLYQLTLDGVFDNRDDWPPEVSNTMTWTDWEVKVQGGQTASPSCEDEGKLVIGSTITIATQ